MIAMTESVIDSETTTATMMSKYDETAINITNIETVVGQLVEELGEGGFMSTDDITAGMRLEIFETGSMEKHEAEIVDVKENELYLEQTPLNNSYFVDTQKKKYDINVIVNNTMYIWKHVIVTKTEKGSNLYKLQLEGNPKVMNRRKHPRFSINNSCEILLRAKNQTFKGQMVNISAGGYAFACKDPVFAKVSGERIELTISDLDVVKGKVLSGVVIRSTNDHGTYIVGCRMLQDNKAIKAYIESKMK